MNIAFVIMTVFIILAILALCSGCTSVTADLETGKVTVITFATTRQDIDIGRSADGSVYWKAASSEPNMALANALLNMSKVAAKATGVPVQ
jgi:hypothetical protein